MGTWQIDVGLKVSRDRAFIAKLVLSERRSCGGAPGVFALARVWGFRQPRQPSQRRRRSFARRFTYNRDLAVSLPRRRRERPFKKSVNDGNTTTE